LNTALNDTPADSADARIAQALLARGRLKDVDLARALRLQGEAGGSIAALLVRLGMVSERDMAEAASEVLGLPLVLSRFPPNITESRTGELTHSGSWVDAAVASLRFRIFQSDLPGKYSV